MNKRLSKLQRWILGQCLLHLEIDYRDAFVFYGRRYSYHSPVKCGYGKGCVDEHEMVLRFGKNYMNDYNLEPVHYESSDGSTWNGFKVSWKREYCVTNSEKAVVSRCLKSMVDKGLLYRGRNGYRLTESGYVKANGCGASATIVSDKTAESDYIKANGALSGGKIVSDKDYTTGYLRAYKPRAVIPTDSYKDYQDKLAEKDRTSRW